MRAEGIEVVAADRAEWEEAAAAFRLSLNVAAPLESESAPVPDDPGPAAPVNGGNHVSGQGVIGAFTGLFRNRAR